MFVDTILILLLLAWIFFFKVYSGLLATHSSESRVKASQYAIEVHGLPTTKEEGAPNELEIKRHFEQYGPVHSVSIIREIGDLLDIYQQA